ncbi:unnamed protein product [Chrysoparadoxa australica]
MPKASVDLSAKEDIWDVLIATRKRQLQLANFDPYNTVPGDPDPMEEDEAYQLPPALTRRYECRLIPRQGPALALREVRADSIGKLVRVKAMVTRVSDVKPLMVCVAYTCDSCGFEVYQEVFNRHFMPLMRCEGPECKENHINGKLFMQERGSRFIKYQELKIQELPDQVPQGHIPRTMTVHCKGDMTRQCTPGDICTISCIFLPTLYSGFRAMKAGLTADTYVEAQQILRHKKGYNEDEVSPDLEREIDEAAEDPEIFSKLARSIAPEIYGHVDIKKTLLLQLVGGVTKVLPDGMKIRGDINICLMGDPGVAKSQLLKYISSTAPRGVYTTGKGSSGVGLTAAIVRDAVTGEMALEGGALVLADLGICCIDEFDKMEDGDRTAIHEVMEQQTVSIAKAGITTTLNARAAVLAAANPIYGRYNKRRSISENINLPNSLISRFDIIFLVLDQVNLDRDIALARHVTYVHQHKKNPDLDFEPYSVKFMKAYIGQARLLDPYIPEDLTGHIAEAYVGMRQQEQSNSSKGKAKGGNDQAAMTARQLLSILRLSQALARLKFIEAVTSEEVDEAIRLTHMSKASLEEEETGFTPEDVTSRVYGLIRDHRVKKRSKKIGYKDVEAIVLNRGFSAEQLRQCIEEYCNLHVFELSEDKTQIEFQD